MAVSVEKSLNFILGPTANKMNLEVSEKKCELSRCPIAAHLSSFGIWVRSVIKLQQRTFDMYRYLNMGCNRVTKNVQAQSAMSKPGLFTWLCSKWIQMG